MTNTRLRKLLPAAVILSLFFFIRGLVRIYGVAADPVYSGFANREILSAVIGDGYFGFEEFVLVGSLLLLITAEYVSKDEGLFRLLRCADRSSYLRRRAGYVVEAALLVCFLRTAVGFCFLWKEFGGKMVFTEKLTVFLMLYFFLSSLYSMHCIMLYMIFRDLFNNKNTALIVMMLIQLTSYYIVLDQWLFPLFHHAVNWLPFSDTGYPYVIYEGTGSAAGAVLAMIRQSALILTAGFFWSYLWEKKDIISLET